MKRIPLKKLKRWPTLKRFLIGHYVRIFSAESSMYWRDKASGYTPKVTDAGIYEFEHAFSLTFHCGPEKGIEFEVSEPEYTI